MSNEPGAVLHGDEVRELEQRLWDLQVQPCACDAAWAERGLVDPMCVRCNYADAEVLAADAVAELRRLQSELDRLRGCEALLLEYRAALGAGANASLAQCVAREIPTTVHNIQLQQFAAKIARIDAATEARTLGTEDEKPFRGTNESGFGIGDSHRRNGGGAA